MQTTANSRYTVLVVDDDIALSTLWQQTLSGAGFNVLTSSSGVKGLDMIRHAGKVDVVLLDYNMPVLDGSQTLEHLKDQFPHVKTIGVTGVDTSRIPDTFRNGVEQLLLKPVKTSDLVGTIHSVLGVAVGSKTGKRGTAYWIRFGLWYALYVGCCYGILRGLYEVANKTMLAH